MEKKKPKFSIPGTKPSPYNAQLLISSGISTLDEIVGGGFPVGTVILVEEDINGSYAKILLNYFLAEGVANGHSLLVASQDTNPRHIVSHLPAVITSEPEDAEPEAKDEKMKIAWRYQNQTTQQQPSIFQQFGHYFDLSKRMEPSFIQKANISYWSGQKNKSFCPEAFANNAYHDLLTSIKEKITEGEFSLTANPAQRSVLRIALHSLGSPVWLPDKPQLYTLERCRDLDMFLFCLRALVRSAFAVAVVTIPSHVLDDSSIARCIHCSDISLRLEAFGGTDLESNASLSEYHGFFHVVKLAAINTLIAKDTGPIDYAFKLRRKKFSIEIVHLPPELQDSGEKEDDTPGVGCGSSNKHLLEF